MNHIRFALVLDQREGSRYSRANKPSLPIVIQPKRTTPNAKWSASSQFYRMDFVLLVFNPFRQAGRSCSGGGEKSRYFGSSSYIEVASFQSWKNGFFQLLLLVALTSGYDFCGYRLFEGCIFYRLNFTLVQGRAEALHDTFFRGGVPTPVTGVQRCRCDETEKGEWGVGEKKATGDRGKVRGSFFVRKGW